MDGRLMEGGRLCPVVAMVPPGDGKVYSPHEVPPGINMTPAEWWALSDAQRRLNGDRRFAKPVSD